MKNLKTLCEAYAEAATREHLEVLVEMVTLADGLRERDLTAHVALPGAISTRPGGYRPGPSRHVGSAAWEAGGGSVSCTSLGGIPEREVSPATTVRASVDDATDAVALAAAGAARLAQLRQQLAEYRAAATAAHHAADVSRAALLASVTPAGVTE